MDIATYNQTIILQKLAYYEAAYASAVKLLKVCNTDSEAYTHLFSAAKYYQDKNIKLRKELVGT